MKRILAAMLCAMLLAGVTGACAETWFIETIPADNGSFAAVQEEDGAVYVQATADVNMRKGPGTAYGVMGSVKKGARVEYAGETSYDSNGTGWYKVNNNGVEAWICAAYAEFDDEDQAEYSTYVLATAHVNVRSGPSGSYEDLGTLEKGEQVKYLGVSSKDAGGVEWHKIQYYSYFEGWVCSTYCKLVQGNSVGVPEQDSAVTGSVVEATKGKSNLRTGPGLGYKDVATIKEGDKAAYLGRYSVDERGVTWYYVQYDGKTGWVSSRYTTLK